MMTCAETWTVNGINCVLYRNGDVELVDCDGDQEVYRDNEFVSTTAEHKDLLAAIGLDPSDGVDMAERIRARGTRGADVMA